MEFAAQRDVNQVSSKVRPLEKASMNPRGTALRDKGEQQSWQICKDVHHRAQELMISRHKKSGKEDKSLARMRRDCWSN